MKLLLDQGLPRSTIRHLTTAGIAAEHVGDLGMAAASDDEILTAARKSQAIVATLDADFHQLLAASGATLPSVVRIRVEGLKGKELASLLEKVVASATTELASGAVVSVTKTRMRVRSLPIGR